MTPSDLTAQDRYDLITKNLEEVLNGQIIKAVLEEGNRPLRIYWGMFVFQIIEYFKIKKAVLDSLTSFMVCNNYNIRYCPNW